jgi:UDPglucose 6-dehydrogenase
MKVGLFGRGFVGEALYQSFTKRGAEVFSYDKYKNIGSFESAAAQEVIFLCLPTPYVEGFGFDCSALYEVCNELSDKVVRNYSLKSERTIVIKSTVEPGILRKFSEKYPWFNFVHNPEFLTARTANEDFDNQKHIVLGHDQYHSDPKVKYLSDSYKVMYPDAKITLCTTVDSESMKIFVNNFYAVKVQMFNEFYMLCQRTGADYEVVKEAMLENGWINPMHTNVPGPDGSLSYSGACFPKDTKALLHLMKTLGTPHEVLEGCVSEQRKMRND